LQIALNKYIPQDMVGQFIITDSVSQDRRISAVITRAGTMK
jgi:hypothetical protein